MPPVILWILVGLSCVALIAVLITTIVVFRHNKYFREQVVEERVKRRSSLERGQRFRDFILMRAEETESETMTVADSIDDGDIGSECGSDQTLRVMESWCAGFEPLKTYRSGELIQGGSPKGVLAADGLRAWRHTATGVRVILFSAPGPLTSANIVVGTLPESDGGHPHTLEHIIFLGSRLHPARGYLDTLANRSLADGTNAYTDVDHTVYQASGAGFEGLSRLLPAFVDHVLRPRISRAAFMSEVYYTTSECKEAGVVFCEMHGRENTEDDLADTALRTTLFAGTPLALSSGGICSHIRDLTAETIQRYHDDYYVGHNVSILVGGSDIDPAAFLDSLRNVLDDIAKTDKRPRRTIPWHLQTKLEPMPPVTRKLVNFPCPDEDIGTVILAWRGPPANQMLEMVAIQLLLQYLTVTVSSPLRQKFVECEDPLSSHIYYEFESFLSTSKIALGFAGISHRDSEADDEVVEDDGENTVKDENPDDSNEEDDDDGEMEDEEASEALPQSMLTSGEFADMAMEYLKSIVASGKLPGSLQAVRLTIKRERESYLAGLEEDSHELVPTMLIEEVLYADSLDTEIGEEARGVLARLDELDQKDEQFWLDLLKSSIVDAPRFELFMTPDPTLADKLAEEDKKLSEERVVKYGKEELVQIGKRNEEQIEALTSVEFGADEFPPLPSAKNISRIPFSVQRNQQPEYWAQSLSINTDFIHTTIMLNTSSLSLQQRLVLPLITSLLLNSDVNDNGNYISFSESSYAITEVTVATEMTSTYTGYSGGLAQQCLKTHFTSTPKNCAEAFRLVLRALFKEEVTLERLSTIAKNELSDITECSRSPVSILHAAAGLLEYLGEDTVGTDVFSLPNFVLAGLIAERPLVSNLSDEVAGAAKAKESLLKVVNLINETLAILRTLPSSDIFVQIAATEPQTWFEQFKTEWGTHRSSSCTDMLNGASEANSTEAPKLPITRILPCWRTNDSSTKPDVARIIGVPGAENSYIDVRVNSDVYPGHKDWASLSVLDEMLCRMEGPLSDAIRKSGLAYGYGVGNQRWKGFLRASINESSTPAVAWVAMVDKLNEFRSKMSAEAEQKALAVDLDTAKSITMFSLSTGRSTPECIVKGVISAAALGKLASPLADRALEESIEAVVLEDIAAVFDRHIARLLVPGGRRAVLTCGPHAVASTIDSFNNSTLISLSMGILDDPENIRWTWAGHGQKERDATYYDAARVRVISDGTERLFRLGDAVYVAVDGAEPWVAHLVEMYEIGSGTIEEDDDLQVVDENNASRRMRCTLRWFYNPDDIHELSKAERSRSGIPSPIKDELYFSDHVEKRGSNGLEVIEGRAYIVPTRTQLDHLRVNRPDGYWDGDQIRLVRCFYGSSASYPPPVRQLEKSELDNLLANPTTEPLYNRLTRPSKYGTFSAVLKGTRKRRTFTEPTPAAEQARSAPAQASGFEVDDDGIPISFGPKRMGRQGLWGRHGPRDRAEPQAPLPDNPDRNSGEPQGSSGRPRKLKKKKKGKAKSKLGNEQRRKPESKTPRRIVISDDEDAPISRLDAATSRRGAHEVVEQSGRVGTNRGLPEVIEESGRVGLNRGRPELIEESGRVGLNRGRPEVIEESGRAGLNRGRPEVIEESGRAGLNRERPEVIEESGRAGLNRGRPEVIEESGRAGLNRGRPEVIEESGRAGLNRGRPEVIEESGRVGLNRGLPEVIEESGRARPNQEMESPSIMVRSTQGVDSLTRSVSVEALSPSSSLGIAGQSPFDAGSPSQVLEPHKSKFRGQAIIEDVGGVRRDWASGQTVPDLSAIEAQLLAAEIEMDAARLTPDENTRAAFDLDGIDFPELDLDLLDVLDPVQDSISQMKETFNQMSINERNIVYERLEETLDCILKLMDERQLTFDLEEDLKVKLAQSVFINVFKDGVGADVHGLHLDPLLD